METIFDFKPTDTELIELFSYNKRSNTLNPGFSIVPVDKEDYPAVISQNEAILDIAQLLEFRNDPKAADYWKLIPEIERQFRGGFDNVMRSKSK